MENKAPKYDIVNEVLEACILAYPVSSFVISLYKQYLQRGSLSKKQLQGLYGKASKIEDLSHGKLATLEALINRMPTRIKSTIPEPVKEVPDSLNEEAGKWIDAILAKAPGHKRVLFLNQKLQSREVLTPADLAELKKFAKSLGVSPDL